MVYVGVSFALLLPSIMVGALFHGHRLVTAVLRWRRNRGLPRLQSVPTGGQVLGPPLEQTAFALRRLHAQLESPQAAAMSAVRRQAARRAYVERLSEACHALGVTHTLLTGEAAGRTPRLEVFRVEAALAASGLDVSLPAPREAAA